MFKNFIVKNFPSLGKYKRFVVALRDSLGTAKTTYSQHGEDAFIWSSLQRYNLTGSIYVDIGANHPTDISNTYLLYRNGLSGIIIEPNEELINLFKRFRKKDIPLMIGCSNKNGVLKFNISRTPVISSFSDDRNIDIYKSVYIPVMPVDAALSDFNFRYISLLSIDVEGLNYEVLQGARETIQKSLLICIEYDTQEDISRFTELLGPDFEYVKTIHCNVILLNKKISMEKLISRKEDILI